MSASIFPKRTSLAVVLAECLLIAVAYAQPNKEAYELQERCSKRAAEIFQKDYTPTPKGNHTTVDYENHYSDRLNKCFFLEKWGSFSSSVRSLVLIDLSDHKTLGEFTIGPQIEPYCEFQGKTCHSEQEWRDLARPFLEE